MRVRGAGMTDPKAVAAPRSLFLPPGRMIRSGGDPGGVHRADLSNRETANNLKHRSSCQVVIVVLIEERKFHNQL